MSQANATTDHTVIRRWAESRNGRPSVVKSTKAKSKSRGQSGGLLRIDFNTPEESLDDVSWDEFFETFDQNNLAFLYQEETASGRKSRFNKFVSRDTVEVEASDSEEDAEDAEDEDEDLDSDEELQDEEDADEDWDDEDEDEDDDEDEVEDEDDRR